MQLSVDLLRDLFRHLIEWRSLYSSDHVDSLPCPDGDSVSLWDIEYYYSISQIILPIRQRQAIRLCLLFNFSEQDAARIMKIDDNNPVSMYATAGLEKIIHLMRFGLLPDRQHVNMVESKRRLRESQTTEQTLRLCLDSIPGCNDVYITL